MTPAVYTSAQWDGEYGAIFFKRAPPPACPACHRTGFFGPRKVNDRRYSLCKFCGAYQAIGGERTRCVATVHGCSKWPMVAAAPYLWWVQPDETGYDCPYCGQRVQVAAAVVKRPSEDPAHPWARVPQHMSFEQAAAFWLSQGRPRVYL